MAAAQMVVYGRWVTLFTVGNGMSHAEADSRTTISQLSNTAKTQSTYLPIILYNYTPEARTQTAFTVVYCSHYKYLLAVA